MTTETLNPNSIRSTIDAATEWYAEETRKLADSEPGGKLNPADAPQHAETIETALAARLRAAGVDEPSVEALVAVTGSIMQSTLMVEVAKSVIEAQLEVMAILCGEDEVSKDVLSETITRARQMVRVARSARAMAEVNKILRQMGSASKH